MTSKISLSQFVIQNISEAVFFIAADGSFLDVNTAACKSLGYTQDELLLMTVFDIDPNFQQQQWNNVWQQYRSNTSATFESKHINSTGNLFPVEVNANYFIHQNQEYICALVRDISLRKQNEIELQLEHERACQYLDISGAIIMSLDTRGLVQLINRKGYEILGYSKEEILHQDWFANFLPPQDVTALRTAYDEFLTGNVNSIEYYENQVLTKNGQQKIIAWRNVRLLDDNGKVTGALASGIDITDKKRAESEAEQAKQEWDYALDFLDDPTYLLDQERRVIRANQAFYKLTASSKENIIGRTITEIFCPQAGAEPCTICQSDIELRDSTTIMESDHPDNPTNVPVEVVCCVIKDMQDKPSGALISIRDLSHIRETTDKLNQSRAVYENSIEAILITDENMIISYINPAFTEITGYTLEEVIGKNPSILKSNAQDQSFYQEMISTIKNGNIWRGSLTDKKKDGSYYPALMTVTPVQNTEGVITHYVATQQDLTEYRRLEEQFNEAQKMETISTLVGGIAHDFNNMLSGILGNLYFARQRAGANEALIKNIDAIDTLSHRAADMIKQLLTFARKDQVEMHGFSLNSFLKDAFNLAQTGIKENIERVLELSPEPMFIHGNTTQLQQIMMNLLNNARDAVDGIQQPKITCTLQPYQADNAFIKRHPESTSTNFALLTVTDNGAGIHKEIIDKIFEPFFSTKKVGKGTGLGLAMVYGAIKTHDGIIEINSETGKGTTFKIYLPLITLIDVEPTSSADEYATANGELILVADDDATLRLITEDVLTDLGYSVVTAVDGIEAFQLYQKHKAEIALVILDVVMPGMNGVSTAVKIRQHNGNMPIIFATGYDSNDALTWHQQVENSVVLSKPFPLTKLSRTIWQLLEA